MLGLAEALPERIHTTFLSFREGGRSAAFLDAVRAAGFRAEALTSDFPRIRPALRELAALLRDTQCDALLCHGYKADILGRIAARRVGVPVIAVSRGWTCETSKVRFYEWLDRRNLRFMDRVVCVSEGQAAKVRRWCGVADSRLSVIHNSARLAAFEHRDPTARPRLLQLFPKAIALSRIVVAAGRLSPEKGFGVLVEAAATICREQPNTGIVLFGEGPLRPQLERRAAELGLSGRFVMPGFRNDLDSLLGAADVVVLPSFTEGLPNVALEASAAGVPIVATAVGGTPEVVRDGETGSLVEAGDAAAIASKVNALLNDPARREQFGAAAKRYMQSAFTFRAQANAYLELLEALIHNRLTLLPGSRAPMRTPLRDRVPNGG